MSTTAASGSSSSLNRRGGAGADDPITSAGILEELRAAPEELHVWVTRQRTRMFDDDPAGFRSRMAAGGGTAQTVEEIRELWDAVIEPGVG
jgi:hypothetical protein